MIRVRKSEIPAALVAKADGAHVRLCERHAAGETLTFDRNLYADPTVKAQLLDDQDNKCCFCERVAIESADVEHFRPKGGVAEDPAHPGYFWLAYAWANLYACCSACNSRAKKNQFPLEPGSPRASAPTDRIADERPLLLDPAVDDPEAHIGFNKWDAFGRTPQGRATVAALKLNSRELTHWRRDRWIYLEALWKQRDNPDPGLKEEAERKLKQFQDTSEQFASMARQAVRDFQSPD